MKTRKNEVGNIMASYDYDKYIKTTEYKNFPKLSHIWHTCSFYISFDDINLEKDTYGLKKLWKKYSNMKFDRFVYMGMISGYNKDDIESWNNGYDGTSLIIDIHEFILKKRYPENLDFPRGWIMSPNTMNKIHEYFNSIGILNINEETILEEYIKYMNNKTFRFEDGIYKCNIPTDTLIYFVKNRNNINYDISIYDNLILINEF